MDRFLFYSKHLFMYFIAHLIIDLCIHFSFNSFNLLICIYFYID